MKERGVSIKQIHACRLQVLSEIRLKDKYILDYICPISAVAGKIDNSQDKEVVLFHSKEEKSSFEIRGKFLQTLTVMMSKVITSRTP